MKPNKQFREWKKWFRTDCASRFPMRITLVAPSVLAKQNDNPQWKLQEHCHCTLWTTGEHTILIQIANNLNANETFEAMMHGVAHAIRYYLPDDLGDSTGHDPRYWSIFGEMYRRYYGEA